MYCGAWLVMGATVNVRVFRGAGILLIALLMCSRALAGEQLVQVNYDVQLTVGDDAGSIQQRGIAKLGKVLKIDFGQHLVEVMITPLSMDLYTLDVSVLKVIGDKRAKLSDDTSPYKSSFGVPTQVEISNELLKLDLSIVVGHPFEESTD